MMGVSVDQAKEDAKFARERLFGTVHEIQSRVAPSNLLEEAVSEVKTRSVDLAHAATETVRERPVTVAAAVTAGIALLAHRPLWRLARKMIGRSGETEDDDAS